MCVFIEIRYSFERLYSLDNTTELYLVYDKNKMEAYFTNKDSAEEYKQNVLTDLPYIFQISENVLVLIQKDKVAISFPSSIFRNKGRSTVDKVEVIPLGDLFPCKPISRKRIAALRSNDKDNIGMVTERKSSGSTGLVIVIIMILILLLLLVWYCFFHKQTVYRRIEKTTERIKEKTKTSTTTTTANTTEKEQVKI